MLLSVTTAQAATIKTALEWYADDRRECAKHTYAGDEADVTANTNAAAEAMDLLGELEAQERYKFTLFIVEHSGNGRDNRDDYDLYVRAGTEAEAIIYWREYYKLSAATKPERVRVVPTAAGPVGAIAWEQT